ncbi:MAG: NHL repeat-containing protein [Candidatus Binataceae bacterium]
MGGQQPIAGATVTLYAAGEPGGTAAAAIISTTTNTDGDFVLPSFTCPSGTAEAYVVATGGNPGGGTNAAVALMAMAGECAEIPSFVDINELTTAAAVYAMAQFMGIGSGCVDCGGELAARLAGARSLSGKSPWIDQAAQRASGLVDVTSGGPGITLPSVAECDGGSPPINCTTEETLDQLADVLAACVNSSGLSSSECQTLFCDSTPGGTYSSSCSITAIPTDTLQADLSIALNPGTVYIAGLYNLAGPDLAFSPGLATAPNDWTLSLNFSSGAPEVGAYSIALDGSGNVWTTNNVTSVTELAPDGNPISPSGGYTNGIPAPISLAIDASGNVWVTNCGSASNNPQCTDTNGSVSELNSSGDPVAGSPFSGGGINNPIGIAIDLESDVWIVNPGNASVTELDSSGSPVSPSNGFTGGGLNDPEWVAIDGSGGAWITDFVFSRAPLALVSEFASNGTPAAGSPFSGGGIQSPQGVAIDRAGDVWITNCYNGGIRGTCPGSVSELDSSGTPLSPSSGFNGGGVSGGVFGVAIDGTGNVWTSDYGNGINPNVAELIGGNTEGTTCSSPPLNGETGCPLSPAAGFVGASLNCPGEIAIDAEGDVWVADNTSGCGGSGPSGVTEFVGVAAPIKTPLIGPPQVP